MDDHDQMTWLRAWLIAFLVVVYFAGTTVWLVSGLIRALGGSPDGVAGAAAVALWAVFLAAGAVGLRQAQRRGWI